VKIRVRRVKRAEALVDRERDTAQVLARAVWCRVLPVALLGVLCVTKQSRDAIMWPDPVLTRLAAAQSCTARVSQ
jgi:hypothetical protein